MKEMIKKVNSKFAKSPRVDFQMNFCKGSVYIDGGGWIQLLDSHHHSYCVEEGFYFDEDLDNEIKEARHHLSVLQDLKKKFPEIRKQFIKEEIDNYKENND